LPNYTYILKCSNNTYYIGSTKDLKRRLSEHQEGNGSNHTKKYKPVELVYYEEFNRIDDAFNREHQIKKWSRAKKEALIAGFSDQLKMLAKKNIE
jgi:putative endonuclease